MVLGWCLPEVHHKKVFVAFSIAFANGQTSDFFFLVKFKKAQVYPDLQVLSEFSWTCPRPLSTENEEQYLGCEDMEDLGENIKICIQPIFDSRVQQPRQNPDPGLLWDFVSKLNNALDLFVAES